VDEIGTEQIQKLKADLSKKTTKYGRPLSQKSINNILAVLSKALRYAEEVGVIDKIPEERFVCFGPDTYTSHYSGSMTVDYIELSGPTVKDAAVDASGNAALCAATVTVQDVPIADLTVEDITSDDQGDRISFTAKVKNINNLEATDIDVVLALIASNGAREVIGAQTIEHADLVVKSKDALNFGLHFTGHFTDETELAVKTSAFDNGFAKLDPVESEL